MSDERMTTSDDRARAEWMPIETAPKDGARLLVHVQCDLHAIPSRQTVAWYEKGRWFFGRLKSGDLVALHCTPTHWMPLPPPPVHKQTEP